MIELHEKNLECLIYIRGRPSHRIIILCSVEKKQNIHKIIQYKSSFCDLSEYVP